MGEDADDITGDHPRHYAPYNCIVTHVRNTLTDDRGKFLEIKVGTWYILMQHDFEVRVRDGQRVEAGGLLGIQGGSGRTINQYRSHLHYEFAKYPYGDARRKPINPVLYFYPFFTPPKYPVKTVVVSGLRIRAGHYQKRRFYLGPQKERTPSMRRLPKMATYGAGSIGKRITGWHFTAQTAEASLRNRKGERNHGKENDGR